MAQNSHRSLKRSGKHSDVRSKAYTSRVMAFEYKNSYVPSSILKRLSWIHTTGLLDWWPKFINRSDLILGNENTILTRPNMSGNILVVFVFLVGGLIIAMVCMSFEMWGSVLLKVKFVLTFVVDKLRNLVFSNGISNNDMSGKNIIIVKSRHS